MKYILFLSILIIPFASKSQTIQNNDSIWGTFVNQVDSSSLYFNIIYATNHKKALNDTLKNQEEDSIQIRPYTKKEIHVLYLRKGKVIRQDTLKFKLNDYQLVKSKRKLWGIPPLFWGVSGQTYRFKKVQEGLTVSFKSWSNAYWIIMPFDRDRYNSKGEIIFYGE